MYLSTSEDISFKIHMLFLNFYVFRLYYLGYVLFFSIYIS